MVFARSRLWIVVALLGMVVLLSSSVVAQEGEMEVGIDRLHRLIMQQFAGVWTQLVQGLAEDAGFMETVEAEGLWEKQEALMEIRWGMMEGMRGPEREGRGEGPPGTFQFVSWIELDRTYWVLDTRTGQMHPRECPPPPGEEREGEE